jgi:hypothetical protein
MSMSQKFTTSSDGDEPVHDLLGHEERQLVAARRHRRIVEVVEQRLRQARLQPCAERAARLEHLPAEAFVPFVEGQHHLFGSACRSSTPGPVFVLTADLIVSIRSCFGSTTLAE